MNKQCIKQTTKNIAYRDIRYYKKPSQSSGGLEYFLINEIVPPESGSNEVIFSFPHFNQLFTS